MKTDRLFVAFAHNDETLAKEFQTYPTPQDKPLQALSARQLRKWKSQRMAYFLLHQIFEKYQLDKSLLSSILRTQSGRPYIVHPQIDFNISHSGDWVAVIFSISEQKKMVGIDIEHPQKTRRYLDLLNYYASPEEIEQIQNAQLLPQLADLAQRFYLSWCLREAVLKSQGVGIVKLSEVQHSLSEQIITSKYCPTGKLCFYHQLPFYLAYFFEQSQAVLSLPTLSQWQGGKFVEQTLTPIIYQVN